MILLIIIGVLIAIIILAALTVARLRKSEIALQNENRELLAENNALRGRAAEASRISKNAIGNVAPYVRQVVEQEKEITELRAEIARYNRLDGNKPL